MKPITGLFLGAGASYELGFPLVWELTGQIKEWLTPEKLRAFNVGWRVQGGGYAESVIEDFIAVSARHDMHYEAILGYLETQFRRFGTTSKEDYHGLYSWLVELVYRLLYYRQVNSRPFFDANLPHYDGLKSLVNNSTPLWVFSLNHDLMVETIARRLSIPVHTGFSGNIITLPRRNAAGDKIGEVRAETLSIDDLDNRAMYYPNPLQSGIYLMKIHGALDIFTHNDGKDLLKLLPQSDGIYGHIEAVEAANEDLLYPIPGALGRKVNTINEISYADDAGEMQFLRRSLLSGAYKFEDKNHQVMPKSMMKHFRSNLNFVKNLICIGYGLGDAHINVVIREWLEFSADRQIEIVNPVTNGVPGFLLHLSPQVKLTKMGATDYLDQRSGISRSMLEGMQKRIAASLRRRGPVRAHRDMNAFTAKESERVTALLKKRLSEMPQRDGKPDLTQLGDPNDVAIRWAAEAQSGGKEFMAALLKYLEETENE